MAIAFSTAVLVCVRACASVRPYVCVHAPAGLYTLADQFGGSSLVDGSHWGFLFFLNKNKKKPHKSQKV